MSKKDGKREWPNLLVQRFGGAHPRNISYLNHVRDGEIYLLPSLPPFCEIKIPGKYIFYQLRDEVKDFIDGVRNDNEYAIKTFFDLLQFFLLSIKNLESGWSHHKDCAIPLYQKKLFDEQYQNEVTKKDKKKFVRYLDYWLYKQLQFKKTALIKKEKRQVINIIFN